MGRVGGAGRPSELRGVESDPLADPSDAPWVPLFVVDDGASRYATPPGRLFAVALLVNAVRDAERATDRATDPAWQWVMAEETTDPWAFPEVCGALGLEHSWIRRLIIARWEQYQARPIRLTAPVAHGPVAWTVRARVA